MKRIHQAPTQPFLIKKYVQESIKNELEYTSPICPQLSEMLFSSFVLLVVFDTVCPTIMTHPSIYILAMLWIRFILIWIRIRIRIRGSVSDDYGSWPNLDKKSKFRNFLAFFRKEKFCGFPLSVKKRLKYSNP